jgi:hypothetical protein
MYIVSSSWQYHLNMNRHLSAAPVLLYHGSILHETVQRQTSFVFRINTRQRVLVDPGSMVIVPKSASSQLHIPTAFHGPMQQYCKQVCRLWISRGDDCASDFPVLNYDATPRGEGYNCATMLMFLPWDIIRSQLLISAESNQHVFPLTQYMFDIST